MQSTTTLPTASDKREAATIASVLHPGPAPRNDIAEAYPWACSTPSRSDAWLKAFDAALDGLADARNYRPSRIDDYDGDTRLAYQAGLWRLYE